MLERLQQETDTCSSPVSYSNNQFLYYSLNKLYSYLNMYNFQKVAELLGCAYLECQDKPSYRAMLNIKWWLQFLYLPERGQKQSGSSFLHHKQHQHLLQSEDINWKDQVRAHKKRSKPPCITGIFTDTIQNGKKKKIFFF